MDLAEENFTPVLLQNFGTAHIENTTEYNTLTNQRETSLS